MSFGLSGAIAIVLYLSITVAIGLLAARRVNSMRDYMIAGNGFGKWLVSFGVVGTIVSGASLLGNVGSGYGTGYALYVMTMGFAFLGLTVAYLLLAKPMTVTARRHEVYTLPDLLALRYGDSTTVRVLSATGVVLGSFIYMVVQFVAMAWVGTTVFGWSQLASVAFGGAVVILYSLGGGIRSAIWTNLFQMILLAGFAVWIAVWGIREVGGLSALHEKLGAISPEYLEPWHSDGAFVWQNVLLYAFFIGFLAYAGVPHVNTKFFTIRNLEVIRWLPFISCFLYLFGIAAIWAGTSYRVLEDEGSVPVVNDPDSVLPTLIIDQFSPFVVGILCAAVLAAVMSTTDSFMLLSGAAIVRDILKQSIGVRMSDRREMLYTRIACVVLMVAAGALALNPPPFVMALMAVAWGALSAMLGPVVYLGMRWRRANTKGAIASLSAGILVGGVVAILNETVFQDSPLLSPWNVAALGVLASYVAHVVVSLATAPEPSKIFAHFRDEQPSPLDDDVHEEGAKAGGTAGSKTNSLPPAPSE
ncbi:sodium/proline symporter [Tamaricihabitans halophyticus]|uniref:Sodium/proline symporter n=1 Tax=Tamaricihabitans halophyticus TaxID=1262583 RepID=A0A4R2QXT2_9PSEU|nr:hypothetical protein [Tamaricihabitans halophyticus]TCP51901.1 sodium/proline symporter [Tamaricihabitans halophyticus]